MKVHLVEAFLQRSPAFFAFANGVVIHFLQKFKRLFAFFALVLVHRHWKNLPIIKF
jgi:hypothetical protein